MSTNSVLKRQKLKYCEWKCSLFTLSEYIIFVYIRLCIKGICKSWIPPSIHNAKNKKRNKSSKRANLLAQNFPFSTVIQSIGTPLFPWKRNLTVSTCITQFWQIQSNVNQICQTECGLTFMAKSIARNIIFI